MNNYLKVSIAIKNNTISTMTIAKIQAKMLTKHTDISKSMWF